MEHLKGIGMKGPIRPAPAVPQFSANSFSPITNMNDDFFSTLVFEPASAFQEKKKPPPRPPPPKIKPQPDIPNKPSHFARKPTILNSLMSRKDRNSKTTVQQKITTEAHGEHMQKIFPKCELRNVQTASLIDLSSPPSSPTFTTRSSSDGLSVDSFGSDATSSTNHHRMTNGNSSQAESGFEDDFDLFLNSRKPMAKEDTMDDFANFDPFSPPSKPTQKRAIPKLTDSLLCNGKTIPPAVRTHNLPTIIRAKPARPKPPETAALLKMSFTQPATVPMNLNMSVPIQRVSAAMDHNLVPSPDSSPERDWSPPMPTEPPPPPPVLDDADLPWDEREGSADEEPYAVALYDYNGDHPDDLSFTANTKIWLIRRPDKEWLFGRLRSGAEGVFPANYVEVRVPLAGDTTGAPAVLGRARALYDFRPSDQGDLPLAVGDQITVISQVNQEWYYGESNGVRGQFPANYVEMF